MNEADKEAYRKACWEWATNSGGNDLGEYMFRAALAHRDKQAEPVAVVGRDFKLLWTGSGSFSDHAQKHGINVGSKLYTEAPAVAVNEHVAAVDWQDLWFLMGSAAENLRSADKTETRVDAAFRIAKKLDEYAKLIDQIAAAKAARGE